MENKKILRKIWSKIEYVEFLAQLVEIDDNPEWVSSMALLKKEVLDLQKKTLSHDDSVMTYKVRYTKKKSLREIAEDVPAGQMENIKRTAELMSNAVDFEKEILPFMNVILPIKETPIGDVRNCKIQKRM